MSDDTFQRLRIEYGDRELRRAQLPAEPWPLFREWLAVAATAGVSEPNAMALATCDADGSPHCRVVLLKQLDERGFVFFTNQQSDKGRELAAVAQAAATFWWSLPANRQVRVEGAVVVVGDAEADDYFASRPRRARLCSAASPQSAVVPNRAFLEQRVAALEARVGDGPVPRPPHWGGYVLRPERIEFWQGREGRLHDRFRYTRLGVGWAIDRLAP